jgi:short-subunit dehydrogenase
VGKVTRRNILITGASSGLGEGMARIFAERGHNLVLTARRVDRLEALRAELMAQHPTVNVVTHQLDVTDHDKVFEVFEQSATGLGGLDRVIVNAGLGKGGRVGTGKFYANAETIATNFTAGLAQCEAAMNHFYERKAGHLVVVSSVSAMRGMPGSMTTYAATKAAIASVAEGIRCDLVGRKGVDIKVTTLFPGYIESEMSGKAEQGSPLMVGTRKGCEALVKAIESERPKASVPAWPWAPLGFVLRNAPLGVVKKMV